MKSVNDLSDRELHDLCNETLLYCSNVVKANLFDGDDGSEYTTHAIDIMYQLSSVFGIVFDYPHTRELLNKWFTSPLESDDHPNTNWSYLAIPPVWDEYIQNKDE